MEIIQANSVRLNNIAADLITLSELEAGRPAAQPSPIPVNEVIQSAINTVDASVGNPLSERQVRQLPLQTRNVVELLSLQPGVTSNGEVMGARRDQNNIVLDGADVNNNQNSGLVAQNTSTTSGGFQGSNVNNANVNSGFNAVLPIPLEVPPLPIYMIWHASRRNDAGHRWLRRLVATELGRSSGPECRDIQLS